MRADFKTWLEARVEEDAAVGDFARDALADEDFPWRKDELDQADYLRWEAQATEAAVEAFVKARAVWAASAREDDGDVALVVLRNAVANGHVDVVRHGGPGEWIGVVVKSEWYGTEAEAELLERYLQDLDDEVK